MKKFRVLFIALLIGVLSGTIAYATPTAIKLIINGKTIDSDTAPQVINGHTMVPLKLVADALGVKVAWDQKNNAVIITSNSSGTSGGNPSDLDTVGGNPTDSNNTSVDITQLHYDKADDYIQFNSWRGKDLSGAFEANGQNYSSGIAADCNRHCNSQDVTYTISNKGYLKLTGLFATDDHDDSGNTNRLVIYGDDKEIYKTPDMARFDKPLPINIDISGLHEIKIHFDTSKGSYPILLNPRFQK